MTKRRPMPDWLASLYDDVFARAVLDREVGEAELAFLHRALGLRPGCSVLDNPRRDRG